MTVKFPVIDKRKTIDNQWNSILKRETYIIPDVDGESEFDNLPYTVKLLEGCSNGDIQDTSSPVVSGSSGIFTYTNSYPPSGNEVYINYNRSYFNFDSSHEGEEINIDYYALGSIVDSEEINYLYDNFNLPGVLENMAYVEKVDNTHINILEGKARLRKDDHTLEYVTWEEQDNVLIDLNDGELRWVVFKWNLNQTDVELQFLELLPTTLDEYEKITLISRIWKIDGELYIGEYHIGLANDPYISRTEAWTNPSYNIDVSSTYSSVDNNYLALNAGEVVRWPIINNSTGRHIFDIDAVGQVIEMAGHLQNQTAYDIIDETGINEEQIKDIANYYDLNGTATSVPTNKFVIHRIGIYAQSQLIVWGRGQTIYGSMEDAIASRFNDSFIEAQWAADGKQISWISYVILKEGTIDFSNTNNCQFFAIQSAGGSGGSANPSWGLITGTLSNQIDLQNALDNKVDNTELDIIKNTTQQPTGFVDPININVSYDSINRTITLTGDVEAYYKGELITELVNGWTSDAHPVSYDQYFLYYNGTEFIWDTEIWDFFDLQISFINYTETNKFGTREIHGFMPWETHKELHATIGTYKESGGILSNYNLNSTTVTDRRPDVSSTTVYDEDLKSILDELTNNTYTLFNLSSTGLSNFILGSDDIVPLSGNRPYYNNFNGATWEQSLIDNNDYMSVWLLAAPMTIDTNSNQYRYIWTQGQTQSASLIQEQSLTPNNINLGNLIGLAPELVFIGRIIIRYTGGNWRLVFVESIDGSRYSQTSSPQGNYLSTISSDNSLSGLGTTTDPLKVIANILSTSTDISITNGDYLLVSDTANITITNGIGHIVNIKSLTSNTITITPQSGTIDGSVTKTLTSQYESCKLVCDGTNWYVW